MNNQLFASIFFIQIDIDQTVFENILLGILGFTSVAFITILGYRYNNSNPNFKKEIQLALKYCLVFFFMTSIIYIEELYNLQGECRSFDGIQLGSKPIRLTITILLSIILILILKIYRSNTNASKLNIFLNNNLPILLLALTLGLGPIPIISEKDAVTKISLQEELDQLSQLSKDKDLEKIKKSKNHIKSLFTKHKQEIFFYQKDKKLYSLPLNEFLDTLGSIPNHYGKYRFNFDTSLCRIEKLDIYLKENSSVKHEQLDSPPSPYVKPTAVTPPIPYPERKFIYKDVDDRHLPETRDEMEKTVEEKVKELFGYIIHIARKDIPYDNKTKVKQLATELFLQGATIEVVNKQGETVFRGSPSKYFNRFGSLQYSKIDLIFDYHGIVDKKELSPNQLAFLKSEFGQKFIGYNSDNNIQYEDYTIKRIEVIAHYIEATKSWGVIFNNIKVVKN